MEPTPREAASREFAKQAVAFAFLVLGMLAVMAIQDKDWVRTQYLRLAEGSRQLLSSAARQAGHTSMGTELATGQATYWLPYHLSLMRDKAKVFYDKAKEH